MTKKEKTDMNKINKFAIPPRSDTPVVKFHLCSYKL